MQSESAAIDQPTTELTTEYAGLPEPFQFYRLMLSDDHLHFGYWPPDHSDVSLSTAQKNLFERLLQEFPEPPASILDVGCGLGLS
ncbi:MAG: cyclopropane-fatty-acyl-phospholipid synthase family protein, partial [Desulfatirhabdiaceae bacterium]